MSETIQDWLKGTTRGELNIFLNAGVGNREFYGRQITDDELEIVREYYKLRFEPVTKPTSTDIYPSTITPYLGKPA